MNPPSDGALYELTDGVLLHHAALAAHELGLFEELAAGPRSLAVLGERLGLAARPTELLAAAAAAFGLVELRRCEVALSATGRAFLLASSPTDLGPMLALGRDLFRTLYSYDTLLAALRNDHGPRSPAGSWLEERVRNPEGAQSFTRAMHAHSQAAARAWVKLLPLGEHRCLLDLGGGSGAHAIAALCAHPQLSAVILELPAVAALARREVEAAGLAARVRVCNGDIFRDPFPDADLHFYGDIFHDWPISLGRQLAAKSFAALPRGGRILVHEMLLDDDRSGPPAVVASGLSMLLSAGGQQYTAGELAGLLGAVGFEAIEVLPTCGHFCLTSGVKR